MLATPETPHYKEMLEDLERVFGRENGMSDIYKSLKKESKSNATNYPEVFEIFGLKSDRYRFIGLGKHCFVIENVDLPEMVIKIYDERKLSHIQMHNYAVKAMNGNYGEFRLLPLEVLERIPSNPRSILVTVQKKVSGTERKRDLWPGEYPLKEVDGIGLVDLDGKKDNFIGGTYIDLITPAFGWGRTWSPPLTPGCCSPK